MTGAAGLATAAVLLQVAYPLVTAPRPRTALTVVTVVVFAAASVAAAGAARGRRAAAAALVVPAGIGLAAEAVGVATGVPFGDYAYAADGPASLGPRLLGVPLVIPLAWVMLAYPALAVGRRLARRPVSVALTGGWALAAWDLFLDPMMVAAGHWRWADPTPALPGVAGIPATNFAGWLLVGVAVVAALDRAVPRGPADDRLPALLYLWTFASSVLAGAAFFGRPSVALVGGLGMGLVAVPYAGALLRARLARPARA